MSEIIQKTLWKQKAYDKIMKDNLVGNLLNSDPSQIDSWVDSNLNTMADARTIIKKIIYILRYLIKHQCRVPNEN